MSEYWNKKIIDLETYVPGEQPKDKKYIKLNTNENPYPPSSKVLKAIKKATNGTLRLYPDPSCDELRLTIAKYYAISKDEIFVGNGSDEVLSFAFSAFFEPNQTILFPDITYSFYPVYANYFNLKFETIRTNDDFSIPVNDFLKQNGGIIIPNPNTPTSKYLPIVEIRKILDYNLSINKIVIVDEAYIDFGEKSVLSLLNKYPNLLVVQTLSKSRSLAGLRIGFAIGHKDLIEGLNRVKSSVNSYTIDKLAIAGAIQAFKDDDYFNRTKQRVIRTRKWTADKLMQIGFAIVESESNFLFITHTSIKASELYKKLKENGILVRYFNKPRIDNYLRVSVGSEKEMESFVRIVDQTIKASV